MREELREFAQRWVISTVAVLVAAKVVPGVRCDSWVDLVVGALLLGVLNSVLRPLIMLLSLPLLVLTLGLFTLIVNAGMLYLVHLLVKGFHVDGFWSALLGALVVSVTTLLLNTLTGTGGSRVRFRKGRRPPNRPEDPGGPVIDV